MNTLPPRSRAAEAVERIAVTPLADTPTFADRAYAALRDVIVTLGVYDRPGDVRLDERQLAQELGYSGALDGSAEMNLWLHRQVMTKLAESGGKVPDSLKA